MRTEKIFILLAVLGGLFYLTGCVTPQVKTNQNEQPGQEAAKSAKKIVIKKGDTLWELAGKNAYYGDNFKWPLLYKANRDQIVDPDWIEVDQELALRTDYTSSEIEDAVQKAKETPPYRKNKQPRTKLPLKY